MVSSFFKLPMLFDVTTLFGRLFHTGMILCMKQSSLKECQSIFAYIDSWLFMFSHNKVTGHTFHCVSKKSLSSLLFLCATLAWLISTEWLIPGSIFVERFCTPSIRSISLSLAEHHTGTLILIHCLTRKCVQILVSEWSADGACHFVCNHHFFANVLLEAILGQCKLHGLSPI